MLYFILSFYAQLSFILYACFLTFLPALLLPISERLSEHLKFIICTTSLNCKVVQKVRSFITFNLFPSHKILESQEGQIRQLDTSFCSFSVSSPLSLLNTSSGRLYMSKVDEEMGSDMFLKIFPLSKLQFSKCNLMLSPRQIRMDWKILKRRHRKGNYHLRFRNCPREDRNTIKSYFHFFPLLHHIGAIGHYRKYLR